MVEIISIFQLDGTIKKEIDYVLTLEQWQSVLKLLGYEFDSTTDYWIGDNAMFHLEEV